MCLIDNNVSLSVLKMNWTNCKERTTGMHTQTENDVPKDSLCVRRVPGLE